MEEAASNIREATALYVETLVELGEWDFANVDHNELLEFLR